jgi:hypothetical protein
MRSETITVVLDADREAVFRYLAEVENLPKWATEFARELRREGEDYKVVNNRGEFFFAIHSDLETGVIDMLAGPDRAQMAHFPTRVVGLPDGRAAYSFTMFQGAEMPAELFDDQYESLKRELANIEAKFASL